MNVSQVTQSSCGSHHWVVATPSGRRTSRGTCKHCGTVKRFPNAFDDIVQDRMVGDVSAKPASRLVRRTSEEHERTALAH